MSVSFSMDGIDACENSALAFHEYCLLIHPILQLQLMMTLVVLLVCLLELKNTQYFCLTNPDLLGAGGIIC